MATWLPRPGVYKKAVVNVSCLTVSDRGPRNSSPQRARCTPVVGRNFEHHTGRAGQHLWNKVYCMVSHRTNARRRLSVEPIADVQKLPNYQVVSCVCCHVLSEGKERNLPEHETDWTPTQ
ncbi:hypothetical protein TNCV_2160401 [Trichonephila clavipes]|nr:hypothetical protein TNCV_2160401 [Trichonephila clavipes]